MHELQARLDPLLSLSLVYEGGSSWRWFVKSLPCTGHSSFTSYHPGTDQGDSLLIMFSNFIKRRNKTNGSQCHARLKQRKIVFCDWGWHGRSSTNDGWCFSYVDEAEFNPEEDLGCYKRITPDKCLATLSRFAESQLRKNSNVKRSKGWYVLERPTSQCPLLIL